MTPWGHVSFNDVQHELCYGYDDNCQQRLEAFGTNLAKVDVHASRVEPEVDSTIYIYVLLESTNQF